MLNSKTTSTHLTVRRLVLIAMLIAVHVVLSRFLSIQTPVTKVGFSFLASLMGGVLLGPVGGLLVGGIGDFIGAILFPTGAYFPGFTLTSALSGMTYGLLMHREQKPWRIIIAVLITRLVFGLLINTYWIHMISGSPYGLLLEPRIVQNLFLVPIELATMFALYYTGLFQRLKRIIG